MARNILRKIISAGMLTIVFSARVHATQFTAKERDIKLDHGIDRGRAASQTYIAKYGAFVKSCILHKGIVPAICNIIAAYGMPYVWVQEEAGIPVCNDSVFTYMHLQRNGFIATGSIKDDPAIRLIDVDTSKERMHLKGHTKRITALEYSPIRKILFSGSRDRTIRLWCMDQDSRGYLACMAILKHHTAAISCLAVSPDGKLLASSQKEQVCVVDVSTGKLQRTFKVPHNAASIAWDADGKRLVSSGHIVGLSGAANKYVISMFDVQSAIWTWEYTPPVPYCLAYAAQKQIIVGDAPRTFSYITVDTGAPIRFVNSRNYYTAKCMASSPDGAAVAFVSSTAENPDGTLVICNAIDMTEELCLQYQQSTYEQIKFSEHMLRFIAPDCLLFGSQNCEDNRVVSRELTMLFYVPCDIDLLLRK